MALADQIEQLLQDGKPRIIRDICAELRADYPDVLVAVRLLRTPSKPRIWIVGKWEQLAAVLDLPLDGIRKDAGVYSQPGADMLPPLSALSGRRKKKKSSSGSGVIAPPPYRTGFRWGGAVPIF